MNFHAVDKQYSIALFQLSSVTDKVLKCMLTQIYSSGTGVTTHIASSSISFFSGSEACHEPGPYAPREAPRWFCWEIGNRRNVNTNRLYVVFICKRWHGTGPNECEAEFS
jgi:hypothetical protein